MSASEGVSVRRFYPTLGPPGTEVTLVGAGFSPVPGQNVVQFAGIAALVYRATATELIVEVPLNADTGFITVHNGHGTAHSGSVFTVTR